MVLQRLTHLDLICSFTQRARGITQRDVFSFMGVMPNLSSFLSMSHSVFVFISYLFKQKGCARLYGRHHTIMYLGRIHL